MIERRTVDAEAVVQQLSRHVADLTVRLAVAEAQVAAYERADVDRIAAEESENETE